MTWLELFCWIAGGAIIGLGVLGWVGSLWSETNGREDSSKGILGSLVAVGIGAVVIGACQLAKEIAGYLQ